MTPDQRHTGCGYVIMVIGLLFVGSCTYVNVVEPRLFPEKEAERVRVVEASKAAERARLDAIREEERRARQAEAEAAETQREADRLQSEANAAASERATRAALERHAECQVRNRTPGVCYEDWKPTPEAKAMLEMMRTGRF